MIDRRSIFLRLACTLALLPVWGCPKKPPVSAEVQDEALQVGRTVETFPAADEDYFHEMDGGVALTADEAKGRDNWLVWTGGNDRFWDLISKKSLGNLDLLKTISSHSALNYGRHNRWHYLGLVNEPCFEEAKGPDPSRFDLWLDQRRSDCPPDPFENEAKYPGVKLRARGESLPDGKSLPVGSYYGWPTGVIGLRLFPNPDFDKAAAEKWNAKRYYEDSTYYLSKDLVKPYRVGMSCAFCHVGPNPVHPPADPEKPQWADLSSNVGAQYLWIDRIFSFEPDPTSFVFQLFHTSRPGALDTSLVSTDNINNPRTMNAVYALGPRLEQGLRWGKESLAGGGLNNRQFNDFVKEGPLTRFFQPPGTVWTPRVLKDGSDSVGALGALNRVFLNIGLFSEEWLRHFNALVGGKPITPIEIAVARKNSTYWLATEQQTPDLALFFLKSTAPHRLKDAPGGSAYLTQDPKVLDRGKVVFAETCARCHSSKLPKPAEGVDPDGCAGPGYLDCFDRYWQWTKTPAFKAAMTQIVEAPDFLDGNFLSTELRIPVTLLQTNACSPLATNALGGNIWDNFSSQSYKDLPSVGKITVHHPITGAAWQYDMPAGGRGYTRPASLISLWSTAPFLLNNTVGPFDPEPSVEGRMRSFNASIEQMLWPDKRDKDAKFGDRVFGAIDRTTVPSYLRVPAGFIPDKFRPLLAFGKDVAPWLAGEGGIEIGPIPAGTPVNLLTNLDLLGEVKGDAARAKRAVEVVSLLLKIKHDLKGLPKDATDAQASAAFANLVEPLLKFSKCPDFEVNRGHYFGTGKVPGEPGLSDADKRALIEFLKTM
ncbi:MAG TPA: hypothetical protein VN783_11045 [Thermoanaerobaculia bacterium]|nr:hypothetical protein [Thermoanaerobaculia bacterium]